MLRDASVSSSSSLSESGSSEGSAAQIAVGAQDRAVCAHALGVLAEDGFPAAAGAASPAVVRERGGGRCAVTDRERDRARVRRFQLGAGGEPATAGYLQPACGGSAVRAKCLPRGLGAEHTNAPSNQVYQQVVGGQPASGRRCSRRAAAAVGETAVGGDRSGVQEHVGGEEVHPPR